MCPVTVISVNRVNCKDASSSCLLAKTHGTLLRLADKSSSKQNPSALLKVALKNTFADCFIEGKALEDVLNQARLSRDVVFPEI